MLLVKKIGDQHQQEGQHGHDKEKTAALIGHHILQQGRDLLILAGFGDQLLIALHFQIGDSVGEVQSIEKDVSQVRDRNIQRGGELGNKGTERGDDAFVPCAAFILIVFHGIHDRDHHDEVKAVLPEVGEHIAYGQHKELEVVSEGEGRTLLHNKADQHEDIAEGTDEHHHVHKPFALQTAGDGGIEDHQETGDGHADDLEEGEETALVAKLHVNVVHPNAGEDDAVADLLDQEDERDPQQLIVSGNGAPDLFEADGGHRLHAGVALLLDAYDGDGEESRREDGDHQGNHAVSRDGVSADGVLAVGEHGDQDRCGQAADTGKQRRSCGEFVPGICIGAEGGNHALVADVMHGVSDAVEEIHDAEENDEGPAAEPYVEGQIDDDGSRDDADDQPGLEFAPASAGAFDDIAHDRVVQRVENTGGDHDDGDHTKLGSVQALGVEHKEHEKACDQIVDHVPANGAEGEEPKISAGNGVFFHEIISFSSY